MSKYLEPPKNIGLAPNVRGGPPPPNMGFILFFVSTLLTIF
uniref:Uncharacterized protein n=1 Tax=Cyanoptyche gloeocystis TaxID=77922 RepID=A0A3G1IWH5_9EUKA|nr:hypothetical protein [Cyanoptyche gloeocystis]ASQ40330.1 hypothetical protein [Cyanoptyche gloeocystis]